MSVNDIGTPGAALDDPPLTAWQASVRDAFNGSDVTVDERVAALIPGVTTLRVCAGSLFTAGVGITFPVGAFTATPMVVATAHSGSPAIVTTAGISSTGFTVRCFDITGAALSAAIDWLAVQLEPPTVAGFSDELA